jgi:Transposase DDE domain
VSRDGRRFGARPNPYVAPEVPPGKINVTDLDSRNVKTPRSYTEGYNVQAVVNEQQIVLAAEVTLSSPDFRHLEPMISATRRELERVGVSDTPGVALADSGYWHEQQIDAVVNTSTQVLIPPDAGKHEKPRRGWTGGRYAFMRSPARRRLAQRHPLRNGTVAPTRTCAECSPQPRVGVGPVHLPLGNLGGVYGVGAAPSHLPSLARPYTR